MMWRLALRGLDDLLALYIFSFSRLWELSFPYPLSRRPLCGIGIFFVSYEVVVEGDRR
jgi:hypothetical protein